LYVQQLVYVILAASQHKRMTYTSCCVYRVEPPDDVAVNLLETC